MDPKDIARTMMHEQFDRWAPILGDNMDTNTQAIPVQKQLEGTKPTLTMSDRCDACGARAYYKAEFAWWTDESHLSVTTGDLLFCGHCSRVYEDGIHDSSFAITDERWNIL